MARKKTDKAVATGSGPDSAEVAALELEKPESGRDIAFKTPYPEAKAAELPVKPDVDGRKPLSDVAIDGEAARIAGNLNDRDHDLLQEMRRRWRKTWAARR